MRTSWETPSADVNLQLLAQYSSEISICCFSLVKILHQSQSLTKTKFLCCKKKKKKLAPGGLGHILKNERRLVCFFSLSLIVELPAYETP